jgi:hypothetical protein
MHAKGVQFAIYTAESATTCAGYPASKGYETIDGVCMRPSPHCQFLE